MNTIALIISLLLPSPVNGEIQPESEVILFDTMGECIEAQAAVQAKAHADNRKVFTSCQGTHTK